jgi:Xaa-Pro aminopeptidase
MNNTFFTKNRKGIMEKINEDSLLVMFSGNAPYKSGDEQYAFTVNRNFYYMTGIGRPNMILMLHKTKQKCEEILFIEKVSELEEKWTGKRMRENEAEEVSGIKQILPLSEFEGTFNSLVYGYNYKNLYMNLERIESGILPSIEEEFVNDAQKKYPQLTIRNIYHDICEMRVIKTPEEIEVMREAISITKQGIEKMMKNAKPEMMEYEIEAYFDFVLKSNGVTEYAFSTIAAAGQNATVLHYMQNNTRTKDGDLILFDLGAQYKYYNADISRTFPVNGKFTERQKEIYNIVLEAQNAVFDAIKVGATIGGINDLTKKVYAKELKRIGLIKDDSEVSKYYFHSISHFLGLDTHDVGSRSQQFREGMVLTVEPGLYIPEYGIGIRTEDDVLVTKDGCENLSKDIIKSIEDVENFMNQ